MARNMKSFCSRETDNEEWKEEVVAAGAAAAAAADGTAPLLPPPGKTKPTADRAVLATNPGYDISLSLRKTASPLIGPVGAN